MIGGERGGPTTGPGTHTAAGAPPGPGPTGPGPNRDGPPTATGPTATGPHRAGPPPGRAATAAGQHWDGPGRPRPAQRRATDAATPRGLFFFRRPFSGCRAGRRGDAERAPAGFAQAGFSTPAGFSHRRASHRPTVRPGSQTRKVGGPAAVFPGRATASRSGARPRELREGRDAVAALQRLNRDASGGRDRAVSPSSLFFLDLSAVSFANRRMRHVDSRHADVTRGRREHERGTCIGRGRRRNP